jgi:hypothetical protein
MVNRRQLLQKTPTALGALFALSLGRHASAEKAYAEDGSRFFSEISDSSNSILGISNEGGPKEGLIVQPITLIEKDFIFEVKPTLYQPTDVPRYNIYIYKNTEPRTTYIALAPWLEDDYEDQVALDRAIVEDLLEIRKEFYTSRGYVEKGKEHYTHFHYDHPFDYRLPIYELKAKDA